MLSTLLFLTSVPSFQLVSYVYFSSVGGYGFVSQSPGDGSVKVLMTPSQLPALFSSYPPDFWTLLSDATVLAVGRSYDSSTGVYKPYSYKIDIALRKSIVITSTAAPKYSLADTVGQPVAVKAASSVSIFLDGDHHALTPFLTSI